VPAEALGCADRVEGVSQTTSSFRELLDAHATSFDDQMVGSERPHLIGGVGIHRVAHHRFTKTSTKSVGLRGRDDAVEQCPSQRFMPRRPRRRFVNGGVGRRNVTRAIEERPAHPHLPRRAARRR
jgi:hypothetical protein